MTSEARKRSPREHICDVLVVNDVSYLQDPISAGAPLRSSIWDSIGNNRIFPQVARRVANLRRKLFGTANLLLRGRTLSKH